MEPQDTQTTSCPESESKRSRIAPRSHVRCSARNRDGSRCRLHCDPATGYCDRHILRPPDTPDDTDLSAEFASKLKDPKSAVQINDFLATIATLVVKNELSARRATVLTAITAQLLRTLPAIEYELNPSAAEEDDEPRFILDLNAREAMQLIELRSGREGHPSYRAVAHEMHAQIAAVHPAVAAAMTHVDDETEPRLERILSEMRTHARAHAGG